MTDSARQPNHLTPPAAYELPHLEDAKRQYVELFGSALVMNTYLKIALLALSLVGIGLIGLNVYAAPATRNSSRSSFASTRSAARRP
jgi:hypothetical protein